jgi:hypothetical protein
MSFKQMNIHRNSLSFELIGNFIFAKKVSLFALIRGFFDFIVNFYYNIYIK